MLAMEKSAVEWKNRPWSTADHLVGEVRSHTGAP
jgi:hypothetical protein